MLGSYFFKRGEIGRNGTNRVFPTLALQLARRIPAYKRSLWQSINGAPANEIEKKSLKSQFSMLLWKPLTMLPTSTFNADSQLIIIDALDECEQLAHLQQLIVLLIELRAVKTVSIRVLLTSRSDPVIMDIFEPLQNGNLLRTIKLDSLEFREDTKDDIRTYLTAVFARIRRVRKIAAAGVWPSADDFDKLIHLSTEYTPANAFWP